jgi:phosphoribosylformylglycinamidine synthase
MKINVLVLRAAGTNCDAETVYAWQQVGAEAEALHVSRLLECPSRLDDVDILTLAGGFSYGDDIAAGKILANQLVHHLGDVLRRFVERGRLVLGICNGFQVLAKTGLLDDEGVDKPSATVTFNGSARYEDRWVHLRVETDHCAFLSAGQILYLPVAHAEGKVVTRDRVALAQLDQRDRIALRYVDADGNPGDYPVNPNGSEDNIAGLTDATGRVLGLMPHPERNIHLTHHPLWTRLAKDREPDGVKVFRSAMRYLM